MPNDKPLKDGTAQRRSTSVPGSYRGFSLQATRFLFHLLTVERGDIVSLEHLDDVGVDKRDGSRWLEQDKSYLSSNPLSDRSIAFWKSLRNWVDACVLGTLVADRSRFVVYAPNASMGAIVQSFNDVQ